MTGTKLHEMTVDELIDRFAEIGVAQYRSLMGDEVGTFNWLFGQMDSINKELRARGRDARLALVRLFEHSNIQVRLQAAKYTLGIAPLMAGMVIEAVKESAWFPQAGDAGMTLRYLDEGIFKPD